MSTEPVTEQDVEKLREWVDDLRVKQPLEAPKPPAVHDPKPTQNVLKAPSELTEGAKLIQKIIESMDLRRQERARQMGALKSKEVEVAKEDREARERLAESLKLLDQEYRRRAATITEDCANGIGSRDTDLRFKRLQIEKIDQALGQLRKQLDVELAKLDPK